MTSSKARPKRVARSYFAGEKRHNRVRLYEHPRDGILMLEYRNEVGRRINISLRHTDRERGKVAADELAAALRKKEAPKHQAVTLRLLFDSYEASVTPFKSQGKQSHDRSARALFERCWGASAKIADLDRRDWDHFVAQRRAGKLKPQGRKGIGGVRDRMIAYDLKFLMAVCNWACTVRVNGQPLLDRNPFKGFPVPVERSPRRPSLTETDYAALYDAAIQLGPDVELFLYLAHESGHRSDSIANLRWPDIDLLNRRIVWRKDKMGRQHATPLVDEHVLTISRIRRQQGRIGDGWVFQSPEDPERHVSRRQVVRWWQQLERRAGLERIAGRGWHSLRRKFADEHDELPLSQLMALGGWQSFKTVVEIYQRPSDEKLRDGLARRAAVRKARRQADLTTMYDDRVAEREPRPLPKATATA